MSGIRRLDWLNVCELCSSQLPLLQLLLPLTWHKVIAVVVVVDGGGGDVVVAVGEGSSWIVKWRQLRPRQPR